METEILERIGLTKGEIKVYFALLELGATTTGPLVDASGISSSKIYLVLDRLMKKGLVSYFLQKRKKYFEAADPRRIVDFLQEREKELGEQKNEMSKLLPSLLKRRELTKQKHQATIFRGMKGLESAYEDVLRTMKPGGEYYVLSAPQAFPEEFRRFLNRYHRRRERQRIRVKLMLSEKLRPTLGADRASNKYVELKYLPQGLILPETILIYGDKAFTIVWGKEPVVFLLESKEYADSMKMFFNMLWSQETTTYRGIEQFKSMLDDTLNHKEVLFIGSGGYFYDRMPKDYVKKYCERAEDNGPIWRNIARPSMRGHPVSKFSFARTRFLREPLENPTVIWIWGDKVANVIWSENPVAFVFENKETAENYRKYFEMLWENAEE